MKRKPSKKTEKRKKREGTFVGRKVCQFCEQVHKSRQNNKQPFIDYKNIDVLKRFVSEKGRIIPRRASGVCAKHQRELTKAIKRARNVALLPG